MRKIIIASLILPFVFYTYTSHAVPGMGGGHPKHFGHQHQLGHEGFSTGSSIPPGLQKHKKYPPGLKKLNKTPSGWSKGQKKGWKK